MTSETIVHRSTVYYSKMESPVGQLLLVSDGVALTGLYLEQRPYELRGQNDWVEQDDALPFAETRRQIAAYFDRSRTEFALPLAPQGTEFQKRVWEELVKIPYGMTTSYGELARRTGNPKASRAVGAAIGRNPLYIVVPCHRVVGADGRLGGYGGGVGHKTTLLEHEGCKI